MAASLKSLGNKAWKVVIKRWKYPIITSKDGTTSLKLKADWVDVGDNESLGNSKELNAIFNGAENNMFRLINTCCEAKEA